MISEHKLLRNKSSLNNINTFTSSHRFLIYQPDFFSSKFSSCNEELCCWWGLTSGLEGGGKESSVLGRRQSWLHKSCARFSNEPRDVAVKSAGGKYLCVIHTSSSPWAAAGVVTCWIKPQAGLIIRTSDLREGNEKEHEDNIPGETPVWIPGAHYTFQILQLAISQMHHPQVSRNNFLSDTLFRRSIQGLQTLIC